MPTSATPQPRLDHLPALDGLRAMAILLVFWAHIPEALQPSFVNRFTDLVKVGYWGVDLFFVLSGFLITRILINARLRRAPLRYFLARRALRIFPIYYLLLAVVGCWRPGREVGFAAVYLSNFYFGLHPAEWAHPLAHTWSLAVEEHFYLFWPLIVYMMPLPVSRRVILLGLPVAIISAAILVLMVPSHLAPDQAAALTYFSTLSRVGSLSLGALLAYHEKSVRSRPGAWSLAAIGVALFAAGGGTPLKFALPPLWFNVVRVAVYALMSWATVTFLVAAPPRGQWLLAPFRAAPARFVGRISYGLYLYHFPIFVAIGLYPAVDRLWGMGLAARTLTAIALTFAVAIASFFLIESPLLQLKDRFRQKEAVSAHPLAAPTPQIED